MSYEKTKVNAGIIEQLLLYSLLQLQRKRREGAFRVLDLIDISEKVLLCILPCLILYLINPLKHNFEVFSFLLSFFFFLPLFPIPIAKNNS